MSNHLENGTVLPFGVLGLDVESETAAFNKSYKNTQMRMGVVLKSYAVGDPNNFSRLSTEYDVQVFEQNENISCTNIIYRNCLSSDGLGSVADFFEKNLRYQIQDNNKNGEANTSDQNGAIVLILCLDGFTNKAVILGGYPHPDRDTTLKDTDPHLEGEYNGVNIVVNSDGSTALTWNSATDNDGKVIDDSHGTTVLAIDVDGTFTITNNAIMFKLDNTNQEVNVTSAGDWTLTVQGNINITAQGNTTITTTGNTSITSSGNTVIDGTLIDLGANAVESVIKGTSFMAYFNTHTHATVLGPSSPPIVPMPPNTLSTKVFTE